MQSPRSIIQQLFPSGTRESEKGIERYPKWPPDLFGAAAYILDICDGYTVILDNDEGDLGDYIRSIREFLVFIGAEWRESGILLERSRIFVQDSWETLVSADREVSSYNLQEQWVAAALSLVIIADEACKGIGFLKSSKKGTWLQFLYYGLNQGVIDRCDMYPSSSQDNDAYWYRKLISRVLERSSSSTEGQNTTACALIPPDILCVQPKTRTPTVGCTLRSLTHHLALLPPQGKVKVKWHQPSVKYKKDDSFNILFVPFPYQIRAKDFIDCGSTGDTGKFDLKQSWLDDKELKKLHGDGLAGYVRHFIAQAEKEVDQVDMILMPELALDDDSFWMLVEQLKPKSKKRNPVLLVTGVKTETADKKSINVARTILIANELKGHIDQKKHHRWKVDDSQIRTYALAEALDPAKTWWEDIDINDRELNFVVFRGGACFTTLICEDLARIDPCQTVIRSLGPNLVFALLMDGPQINGRWPERYAMSLADDPGSSVLSVTSFGLVERSNHSYGSNERSLGLWRGNGQGTESIVLPLDCKAMVLNLSCETRVEHSLDGRNDGCSAKYWKLVGKIGLRG